MRRWKIRSPPACRLLKETSTASWRMWGFDNGGDLSYELNKNAEIYQWSGGRPAAACRAISSSAWIIRRTAARTCPGAVLRREPETAISFRPSMRAELHHPRVEQPGGESVPAAFRRAECDFQRAGFAIQRRRRFRCVNLLRPYPQFDGSFTGLPLAGRAFPLQLHAASVSKSGAASTSRSRAAIRWPGPRTTVRPARTAGSDGSPTAARRSWTA